MEAQGDEHAAAPAKLVVRLLDELAGRATAPDLVRALDGWQLRSSPDAPFRRANSVLPNGELTETPLDDAIRAVEEFYAERLRPARFHISPAAQPPDLDVVLESRGYEIDAPVVVMAAGATIVLGRTQRHIESGGRVTAERGKRQWERANAALHGDVQDARERVLAYGRAIHSLKGPATAVVAPKWGEPVSIGFGVLDQGWTGIFGMGTRPEARRRGAATAVLHTLAQWAVDRHAPRLYLQVEESNTAGRTLYEDAGFVETYRYHYRTLFPPD